MDTAPEDRVAVMSMRAAANQFGYLLGAAAGGLALAVEGFALLGLTLAAMFVIAALVHSRDRPRDDSPFATGHHVSRATPWPEHRRGVAVLVGELQQASTARMRFRVAPWGESAGDPRTGYAAAGSRRPKRLAAARAAAWRTVTRLCATRICRP